MATVQDVLDVARAEIGAPGSVESPLGSNSGTKYHQWYGNVQGYQWCAIFQSWLFFPMLGYKSYYTGDWINYGTRSGWMILAPVPAAICVMDRYPYLEQGGISDHIGVIESVNGAARTMTLIEGNYNDRVARVTRPIDGSTKYYFILPKYSATTTPIKDEQEDEQMFMVEHGDPRWFSAGLPVGKPTYFDLTSQTKDNVVQLFFKRDNGDMPPSDEPTLKKWRVNIKQGTSYRFDACTYFNVHNGGFNVNVDVKEGGPVLVTRMQKM